MDFENVRILKEVRNSVNRQVNCETANIHKTVTAAARQIEDIQYIETAKGVRWLSDGLREVAELPDWNILICHWQSLDRNYPSHLESRE